MYKIGDKISSEKLYSGTKMIGTIIDLEYTRLGANDIVTIKWENNQIAKFYVRDLTHNSINTIN